MYWLKCITLIAVTTFLTDAQAAEGSKAASEKTATADKNPSKEAKFSGAQNDEWSKAQKDVQTAKIKYENDKKTLEELKRSAELQENLSKDSIAKITEATKTVKASEANYQRFLNLYNLRFPEKGLEPVRTYKRPDSERDGIETVEEKPQGVEAKLRRLNRNIKHQYMSADDPKKKPKKKQTAGEDSESLPQSLPGDVTDKITIEK